MYQNSKEEKSTEKEKNSSPKHATLSDQPEGGNVMACMAASGTGLLVFIDDVQIDNEQKDTENILQWLSQ